MGEDQTSRIALARCISSLESLPLQSRVAGPTRHELRACQNEVDGWLSAAGSVRSLDQRSYAALHKEVGRQVLLLLADAAMPAVSEESVLPPETVDGLVALLSRVSVLFASALEPGGRWHRNQVRFP